MTLAYEAPRRCLLVALLLLCMTFMGVSVAGPPTDPERGLRLPLVTQRLRESVSEADVQTILAATQASSLTAADAHDIVWHTTAAVRAYPGVEGLGRVVATLVAEGARGADFGAALVAVHHGAERAGRKVGRRGR